MNNAHLTPAKLLADMPMPAHWAEAKVAFVCYTPYPKGFDPYLLEHSSERYFLHSPLSEVRLCCHQNMPFLVISEVYGFPVGATTVEELIYRGIDTIIGIGYAGAFNSAPMGRKFIAVESMSDLPQAHHYGVNEQQIVGPSEFLLRVLMDCIKRKNEDWGRFRVWNSNSLYREYPELIDRMKAIGCQAVNMDVLSLYAVAPLCAHEAGRDIQYIYVGTITDAEGSDQDVWSSDLSEVVSGKGNSPHDTLVRLMVEDFLVSLQEKFDFENCGKSNVIMENRIIAY